MKTSLGFALSAAVVGTFVFLACGGTSSDTPSAAAPAPAGATDAGGDSAPNATEACKQYATTRCAKADSCSGGRASAERLVVSGGRVLAVTGLGPTAASAREAAHRRIAALHFDGMQYRRDLGQTIVQPLHTN